MLVERGKLVPVKEDYNGKLPRDLCYSSSRLVVSHAVGALSTLYQTPRASTELHVILWLCFRRYICWVYQVVVRSIRVCRTVGVRKET